MLVVSRLFPVIFISADALTTGTKQASLSCSELAYYITTYNVGIRPHRTHDSRTCLIHDQPTGNSNTFLLYVKGFTVSKWSATTYKWGTVPLFPSINAISQLDESTIALCSIYYIKYLLLEPPLNPADSIYTASKSGIVSARKNLRRPLLWIFEIPQSPFSNQILSRNTHVPTHKLYCNPRQFRGTGPMWQLQKEPRRSPLPMQWLWLVPLQVMQGPCKDVTARNEQPYGISCFWIQSISVKWWVM